MIHRVEAQIAGRKLVIETGQLAIQAEGAVKVSYGDTTILSTSVTADKPRLDAHFFPMSVDIIERFYAAGKIKGSRFIKREGRPSDWAILSARLVDRPLRPLFPKESRNEVQLVNTILSVDFENVAEPMNIIGSSAALSISAAPFQGPVGAVGVGYIEGKVIVNPSAQELMDSKLDLVVAGTKDAIVMVESRSDEVDESVLVEALEAAHEVIKQIVDLQLELREKIQPTSKEFTTAIPDEEIQKRVHDLFSEQIVQGMKEKRFVDQVAMPDLATKKLLQHFETSLEEHFSQEEIDQAKDALFLVFRKQLRTLILEEGIRPDGRKPEEIRQIDCQVGLIPRSHGSSLFTRGGTQALNVVTLASSSYEQILDGIEFKEETKKRYMHHYAAQPYSVGETGRTGFTSRREIGHGDLAERALFPVIPAKDEFPYAIRLVSEILGQNGSSSMASVCSSSLSLMDAGVPIKKAVAGIAMGLVYQDSDKYEILSDIQGMEDFCGDMDFKVAGTKDGVTALQMDIKIKGISLEILKKALGQARVGRLHILDRMNEVIDAPREELSDYAPRIITIRINPDKIRQVIGAGGKVINGIIEKTGVEIDIEDDGLVMISSVDAKAAVEAKTIIENLVADPEPNKSYDATVVKIMDFGAFVEFMPGKEGLVHISQLADHRVNAVTDVLQEGQKIRVKLMEIDSQGRYNLSMKKADK